MSGGWSDDPQHDRVRRGARRAGGEELDVEVRSVNHKFCEVKVRLPRELAALEIDATKLVKERLARGGDRRRACGAPAPAAALAPRVDVALAEAYARAFEEIAARLGLSGRRRSRDVAAPRASPARRAGARPGRGPGGAPRGRSAGARRARSRCAPARARRSRATLEGRLDPSRRSSRASRRSCPQTIEHHRTRLAERVQELDARHRARPRAPRPGGRALRRPHRRHRGGDAAREPPRAGASAAAQRRARRPQARLPRPGDAPRGEHHRLEVAERRDRRASWSR